MYDLITEKLFAKNKTIRRGPAHEKVLYLTFDDGPDAEFTPQVLQVLKESGVRATFFLVADKAQRHPEIVQEIVSAGHAIGNHSLDHSFRIFFHHADKLIEWIRRSEEILADLAGQRTVGFRPPAGVITPHLVEALDELNQPLILWSCRFFDTLTAWSESSATRALRKMKSGDIILLHDRQRAGWRPVFLQTLRAFIVEAQAEGWKFEALLRG